MSRRSSQADRVLSDELVGRDVRVSPRKIESMRQAGMLEAAIHPGLGRGAGSRSVRAPDEIDRAEYMARLLDECGSYADAVLAAFVQDRYPIAKDRLERAYEQSTDVLLRWFDRHGGPASSTRDSALKAASKVARYLAKEQRFSPVRDRVRYLGRVHRNAPMHRVMYDLATDVIVLTLMGDRDPALSTKAAETLEVMTGDGTIEDPSPHPPASPKGISFSELARRFHLEALPSLVRSATMQELVIARDAAKTFRAFAQAYGPYALRRAGTGRAFPWVVIGMANDRTVAWSIPAFVLLRRIHGANLDATISFLADWTPFFRAADAFLDKLPPHLQSLAHPDGYESLTDYEKQQLSEHVRRLETTHPQELKILRNPAALPKILR